jgi:adenosylcobinamide-GDP ribazoletransferase
MKDSQIGTYGVLALVLAVGLKFTLWHSHALDFWAIAASAAASRAMMPAIMATTDHARRDGLSHYVGRPSKRQAGIGLFLSVIFLGWSFSGLGLLAFGAACLVAIGLRFLALRKVGGQTGDVLGATQILCELMILMVLLP